MTIATTADAYNLEFDLENDLDALLDELETTNLMKIPSSNFALRELHRHIQRLQHRIAETQHRLRSLLRPAERKRECGPEPIASLDSHPGSHAQSGRRRRSEMRRSDCSTARKRLGRLA